MTYKKLLTKFSYCATFVAPMVLSNTVHAQTNSTPSVSITSADDKSTIIPGNTGNTAEAVKTPAVESKTFNKPILEGKLSLSLFTEDTFQGKDSSNPINNYSRGSLAANLYATENLYLSGNFRFTSPSGYKKTGEYFFDDASVFVGELALRYDANDYSLIAGHSNINYSLARRYASAIWGTSLARSEYGVDGMLVIGGQYKVNAGEFGNHAITVNTFMLDNSFLSDSFGGVRNPTPLSQGGSANTGKFNNFALAIDGLKIKALPKFRYQLAAVQMATESLFNKYTNTAVNQNYIADEQRYLAAAMLEKLDITNDIKLTPLIEYNKTQNSLGIAGFNKNYYTGSLLFTYKQWNMGISASVWEANWAKIINSKGLLPNDPSLSDTNHQLQFAVGYVFENGIKANVGYRKENKFNNVEAQSVALNLSYDLPFAF